MAKNRNELLDFIVAETRAMESGYDRVQRRVKEDSGTAGDQGEENWASVLRKWLPQDYVIVTKGRILGHKGMASPQVDLIVLNPSYPPGLRDKKLYFAGGVAAAFECKLTLQSKHIAKTIENCVKIKRLSPRRTGTPHLELNSPLIYGLLAHSHSWKGKKASPIPNVTRSLEKSDLRVAKHPREMLDIFCVADLATWIPHKHPYWPNGVGFLGAKCTTMYGPCAQGGFSPMAQMLLTLIKKLAWEDTSLRRLTEYYSLVLSDHLGGCPDKPRTWEPNAVFGEKVSEHLAGGGGRPVPENVYGSPGGLWNERILTSDSLSSVID